MKLNMLNKAITIMLISLLFCNVSYGDTAIPGGVTIGKYIDGSTGEELSALLKTTDGYSFFSDQMKENINNLKAHTVVVILNESNGIQYRGTGIAVDKRHILTVNHVTSSTGRNFYNETPTSQPYWATVVKRDASHDIALLEIDKSAPDLISVPMKFSGDDVSIGDDVYTIGHPDSGLFSLTHGVVYRFNEKAFNGIEGTMLNIRISGGNSGGFVINTNGELVGMMFSDAAQIKNLGFMIKESDLKNFLNN